MELEKLKELGLTGGQVSVYTAVLELGIAGINKIQEKTGIERRGIYDILNKLIEKGLVTYTVEKGKRTYQCTHPNRILEEIKKKKNALKQLEEQVPQIRALYEEAKPEIRAEIYRGAEAIKTLLEESLNHKEQWWIGGNSGVETTPIKNWWKHWMKRRAKKGVRLYDLVDHGTYLEEWEPWKKKQNEKGFYYYQQLPKRLSSPMVVLIFGNKVAQILWSKQPFAFVLESKEIKESFMRYFYYFWKGDKNESKW